MIEQDPDDELDAGVFLKDDRLGGRYHLAADLAMHLEVVVQGVVAEYFRTRRIQF